MTAASSSPRRIWRANATRATVAALAGLFVWTPAALATAPVTSDVFVNASPVAGEPEIHVNALDDRNLVIAEGGNFGQSPTTTQPVGGVAYSRDGGLSWKFVSIPNAGDSVLAAGPDGRFYFSAVDGSVHTSVNGGETWATAGNWVGPLAATAHSLAGEGAGATALREVACNSVEPFGPIGWNPESSPGPHKVGCDRPWMAVDPQTGKLYVAFSDHDDASGGGGAPVPWALGTPACLASGGPPALMMPLQCGRIYEAVSNDGGRTFGPYRPIDSSQYPMSVTGGWFGGLTAAHGVIAASYMATGKHCAPCAVLATSANDGQTWTRRVVGPVNYPTNLDTSMEFSPYTAADPSRPGRYAVMYYDHDWSTLLVNVTDNAGLTWKSIRLVEPVQGAQRDLPWISYGPTGALGVMWRTAYPSGNYDVWATVAPGGGTDFLPAVKLSSAESPGPAEQLGDDASYLTLTRDTLYAAWNDRRANIAGYHVGIYRFGPLLVAPRRKGARHRRPL